MELLIDYFFTLQQLWKNFLSANRPIVKHNNTIGRGEERFREEGETAKKDREEGERKQKK